MGKTYDFDKAVDRRKTSCLKYDFGMKRKGRDDLLPLWVADMDFQLPEEILADFRSRIDHGIFGYTDPDQEYFDALDHWFFTRHGYHVDRETVTVGCGVVYGLATGVKAFTKEGDAILIQQPVYYPFSEVIRDNGRVVVSNDLYLGEDNRYHIDLADFEKKIVEYHVKLFLLCSPHNPTGRVFTKEELTAMGDLCVKHGVKVVSDEIHNDFVFQGEHTVFASVKKEYEEISVICTSPSKTFNLASMLISNIFIPNRELRQRFRHEVDAAGISQLSVLGLVAAKAAYGQGDKWYEQMMSYVGENIRYVKEYVKENLPGVTVIDGEGTYLLWLDFRGCGLGPEELDHRIIYEAKLWLDSGKIFGGTGAGFQRINVAAPRAILTECLERIRKIL